MESFTILRPILYVTGLTKTVPLALLLVPTSLTGWRGAVHSTPASCDTSHPFPPNPSWEHSPMLDSFPEQEKPESEISPSFG